MDLIAPIWILSAIVREGIMPCRENRLKRLDYWDIFGLDALCCLIAVRENSVRLPTVRSFPYVARDSGRFGRVDERLMDLGLDWLEVLDL